MSKSKTAKYKITDTNIDKEIIGKQVTVEKIKVKGGPTTKPKAKAPAWFIEFRDEQREFNKSVMQKFDDQAKFNKQQLEFNTRIEKQVSNLRSDLNRIVKLNNLKH